MKAISVNVYFIIIDLLALPSSAQIIDIYGETTTSDDEQCPKRPVFTIAPGGRTANIIWEYVSTFVFAKYLPHKQVPYTQHYILARIVNIFDNTTNTLPIVEDIPQRCTFGGGEERDINWKDENTPEVILYSQYDTEQLIEIYKRYTGNIIVNKYAIFLDPVIKNMDEVKKELQYNKEWIDYSYKTFKEIKSTYLDRIQIDVGNIIFVGIHVRRTDYISYLRRAEKRDGVGADYFKTAIQYFRDNKSKFGTPIFVVVSDEKDWVQHHLVADDVFIAASGDLEYATSDLALLSLCNHSIIDYGTYGLWGAVYSGGHVVTVQYKGDQVYAFLRNNPKWHFVDVTKKPIVIP